MVHASFRTQIGLGTRTRLTNSRCQQRELCPKALKFINAGFLPVFFYFFGALVALAKLQGKQGILQRVPQHYKCCSFVQHCLNIYGSKGSLSLANVHVLEVE